MSVQNSAQTGARRHFLQNSGKLVAAATVAGMMVPAVHAAESNRIRFALIGCGGRGTGAAENALGTKNQGPIQLVAMADVFENKMNGSYNHLSERYGETDLFDVPDERKFIGFDAYKKAIDCLEPGDIAAITTPPAFRPMIFDYAVSKGVHVFGEKPLAVDAPSIRYLWETGKKAEAKNLKVGVGLMCRHCSARAELLKRIQDGQIGDIIEIRCYREHGPAGFCGPYDPKSSDTELEYQIRRFHSFYWASGGVFMDFQIHNIDESCWMAGGFPIRSQGMGSRMYTDNGSDQNFDHYFNEFTFENGIKLFSQARYISGCWERFASYINGTKGSAVISTNVHTPAKCRIYNDKWMIGEDFPGENVQPTWAAQQPEPNPYQLEWDHLIDAIRNDKPYNEIYRGGAATMTALMGMMAVHSGQEITWDQACNSSMAFFKDASGNPMDMSKVDRDTPAPVQMDGNQCYPRPTVGKNDGLTSWY